MSETLARTSADGSQGGAPASQQGRRPAWLTPVNLVIIITTVVALALRVYYQYTRPGFLRLTVCDKRLEGDYFAIPRALKRDRPAKRRDRFVLDLQTHQVD